MFKLFFISYFKNLVDLLNNSRRPERFLEDFFMGDEFLHYQ